MVCQYRYRLTEVQINPQAVKVIKSYGLEEQFKPYVTKNRFLEIRDALKNEVLGTVMGLVPLFVFPYHRD